VKATVPKVFRFFHSMTPAMIWASPPPRRPIASTALPIAMSPALWRFRRTVVSPKPMRPSGAGFAVVSRMISAMTAAWRTDVGVPGLAAAGSPAACLMRRSVTSIASV